MKKIGLIGGSFDPIHKAHVSIALQALEELELDEVQFIPTKKNPWKNDSNASCYDRKKMIEIAIAQYTKLTLNTIEIDDQSDDLNYTINTIDKLIEKNKNTQYYYIVGMDQANLFYKWKEAKRISQCVQMVAFQRGGYTPDKQILEKFNFVLLKNEPLCMSSSDVRAGHIEMLNKDVLKYITKQGIYLESIVASRMKEKRWKHTCSVAMLAKKIAKANHLNEKQAYIAGMFHDIAKEMPYEESLSIMNKCYPQYVNKPVPIWHQWVSRYVCEHEFLIDDLVVLEAIEHHTTASIDISQIGKCVYVADKLDPLRGYDSTRQIELCMRDIDLGFRNSLTDFYIYSKSNDKEIDECFYEIYKYFLPEGEV